MPVIVIKNYQWRQTKKNIIVYVPIKSRPKNVDLLIMDNYVKISFLPFILELFLWENVLEEESECTLTDTEIIFSLQKANKIIDWPRLEAENISKSQKRHIRNRISEKVQTVLVHHIKFRKENFQHLQKEAVKIQVNLDTDMLNRIEALKDSHRKIAMQDFEEWRSNTEIPIFQDISGKVQKNRKTYRYPLKWFKDDLDIMQSLETDKKEEMIKEIEIEKKQQNELMAAEQIKKEHIVERNYKNGSIVEGEIIKELAIEEKLKNKLNIEKDLEKELRIKENLKTEINNQTNLKGNAILNKNTKEEIDIKINTTVTSVSKNINLEEYSSSSEDSELNNEIISFKSSTHSLNKEMHQKLSQKFNMKMNKHKSSQNLINRIFKNRYSKINEIFNDPAKTIPLPRKCGIINVIFSDRAFPTPARESSFVEEQEWLSKQAETRRKTGFVVENLRPEEQDPQWLKDKGDDFFKVGNYLAAISAYTYGIKINDKMVALYMNRSAAHYALGNYYRCIDDCSKVLELMEPKCESNRMSRVKCHARRGAALCKLSAPQHGIPELEAALKLDPNNNSIRYDLYATKQYFNIKE